MGTEMDKRVSTSAENDRIENITCAEAFALGRKTARHEPGPHDAHRYDSLTTIWSPVRSLTG